MARGKYLTNTNLDDLRRRDLFEIQASALDRHPCADVVYQDFFYSFDASLSFDEVARFEFKSDAANRYGEQSSGFQFAAQRADVAKKPP